MIVSIQNVIGQQSLHNLSISISNDLCPLRPPTMTCAHSRSDNNYSPYTTSPQGNYWQQQYQRGKSHAPYRPLTASTSHSNLHSNLHSNPHSNAQNSNNSALTTPRRYPPVAFPEPRQCPPVGVPEQRRYPPVEIPELRQCPPPIPELPIPRMSNGLLPTPAKPVTTTKATIATQTLDLADMAQRLPDDAQLCWPLIGEIAMRVLHRQVRVQCVYAGHAQVAALDYPPDSGYYECDPLTHGFPGDTCLW